MIIDSANERAYLNGAVAQASAVLDACEFDVEQARQIAHERIIWGPGERAFWVRVYAVLNGEGAQA